MEDSSELKKKSTEHSDEYEETSNVAVFDTTTVIEQSQQNLSHIDPSSNLLVARDGTEWTPFAGTNSRGRRLQQNILRSKNVLEQPLMLEKM